jgi:hypothetical protein
VGRLRSQFANGGGAPEPTTKPYRGLYGKLKAHRSSTLPNFWNLRRPILIILSKFSSYMLGFLISGQMWSILRLFGFWVNKFLLKNLKSWGNNACGLCGWI